ncbi:MAG: PAS domain-containing protein [Blastocatellia bacterium]|nr:PAS domain-containing protein [Blastocatellia bacterium]
MSFIPEQHSESLLQAVLGSLREGILVLDTDTQVVLYNQAAADIFKIRSGGARRLLRLVDVTRHKIIHQGFRKVLDEGTSFNSEIELVNGQERNYSFRATPLRFSHEEGVAGVIGVFFDVTQIVKLERIRREFFTNLSHELRTPLTSILVYVETLLSGAIHDIEYNVEFLEIINKHAKRMRNLVQDISDLSAIEAGEVQINPANIEVHKFVETLTPLFSADVTTYHITFTNAVPPGLCVWADAQSLEQILVNLIINAIKFNQPQGSVTVEAATAGDEAVVISVRDTGIGIESHHLPRIFERLYRVDKSRSQEVGGTGLGLAIVKHLVLANKGEITVESVPTQGSVFRVKLPTRL